MTLTRDEVLEKLKEFPHLTIYVREEYADMPISQELLRLVSAYEAREDAYKVAALENAQQQIVEAEARGLERVCLYIDVQSGPVSAAQIYDWCRAEAAKIREGR